ISSLLDFFNLKEAFNTRTEEEIKVGNSIITTLDTDIQRAAYQALGTNKGAVVVLNPKTGEILASVSKPSYDPNNLSEIWESINTDTVNTPMFNRATRGLYPPGSTFKVVTLASALENISGVTTEVFNDTGKIVFSDEKTTLSNYNNNVYGQLSLKKALSVSSNVVFGRLAMDLGNDKLKATAEKFGFNQSFSGSGIPIESSRFPEYDSSQEGLIAQSGIGQAGLLATPMEMAMVAAAVANEGDIMKPTIIKEIRTSSGKTVRGLNTEVLYKAISPENAAIIKDYMMGVVQDRIGSSWSNVFNGLNAAGKTGTADYEINGEAQVPHSWFIGFAPADNPQVAIAVIVENGGTGSTLAAQVSGKVLKAALGQ
ncbi:MAG: peptidoglycan D,D-transpeptidase FtsI family protein, partial [Clostridiaceae bacterium]